MVDKVIKKVPSDWKELLDQETIERSLARLSYEILERHAQLNRLALVGIRTGGEFLARRIQKKIKEIEGREVPLGVLDITLYRDDLSFSRSQPMLKGTDLPFAVSGAHILLVDDVLYTGRTIRAALDAIIDFGRPSCVELCVLIDRGHRELPIRADFVGKNIPSQHDEFVRLNLREEGYKEDGLYLGMREDLKDNGKSKPNGKK